MKNNIGSFEKSNEEQENESPFNFQDEYVEPDLNAQDELMNIGSTDEQINSFNFNLNNQIDNID